MNASWEAEVSSWARWPTALVERLQSTTDLDDRAAGICRLLRELVPAATVSACVLIQGGRSALASDWQAPAASERWGRLVQDWLAALQQSTRGGHFPLGSPAAQLQGLAVAIPHGQRNGGFLLIALPAELPVTQAAARETLLTLAAAILGLHLQIETLQDRLQAGTRERQELATLVTAGDAVVGMAHDLNNRLNTMMLQTALLQMKVGPEATAVIRQEGARAAAGLRPLLQFREQCQQARSAIDLNQAVREALTEALGPNERLQLAAAPLVLLVPPPALRRLIDALLRLARACRTDAGSTLAIRTLRADEQIQLRLEFGASNTAEQDLLDPDNPPPALPTLELLAAQSLARLVEGKLSATTPAVCVSWASGTAGAASGAPLAKGGEGG